MTQTNDTLCVYSIHYLHHTKTLTHNTKHLYRYIRKLGYCTAKMDMYLEKIKILLKLTKLYIEGHICFSFQHIWKGSCCTAFHVKCRNAKLITRLLTSRTDIEICQHNVGTKQGFKNTEWLRQMMTHVYKLCILNVQLIFLLYDIKHI